MNARTAILLTALAANTAPATLAAQLRPEEWNAERALALVARAREVRQSTAVDPEFRSYHGEARGYVYFLIDRPDEEGETLIKADQIALEIWWQAPDRTHQRIVGLRDEKVLPTNIRYHIDHLTVVQDDFGDFIRLGDGDEVEAVLHPIGPEAEHHYDYALADSTTISYASGTEEIRVYEISVRPKVYEEPGFVGSVFVDRASGAIVRMSFTFTPSSYVDPYLDYIRISLDNSLWDGRYWLPYRQEAELRRELPVLDFLAGSIIRGRFEIGRYDFNAEVPRQYLFGRGVSAVPESERESFPFERGLFDDIDTDGLASSPSIDAIRAQATEVLRRRFMSGLSPARLHLGSVSDALRYNRAEGVFLGAGLALRPHDDLRLRTTAGWSIGRDEGAASVALTVRPDAVVPEVRAFWNEPRDVGPIPGASTVIGTLGTAFGGDDYADPYFVRGAEITLSGADGYRPSVSLSLEWHESARDVISDAPGIDRRPVREVDEGVMGSIEARAGLGLPAGGSATGTARVGRIRDRSFASLVGRADWRRGSMEDGTRLDLAATAGVVTSDAPPQELFLLGGRGTLPGHPYRSFEGDRFWVVEAEATRTVIGPLLGVRAFGAIGGTRLEGGRLLPPGWLGAGSDGLRASVGVGISLGWDVLRLDLARGFPDGIWELAFSAAPHFREWL